MSGLPILDLVVGMIFIYFLLSIISSSAVEIFLTGLRIRSKVLAKWLLAIFNKPIEQPGQGGTIPLGQAIMDHCSITALTKAGKAPSYIDARNFTSALMEKVTYAADPKNVAEGIDDMVAAIRQSTVLPTDMQRLLLTYANEAKQTYAALTVKTSSEVDLFKAKIEHWYDSNMERISGRLKVKYARPFTVGVAIACTIFLNADSISIAKFLYGNPQVSEALAAEAMNAVNDTATLRLVQNINQADTNQQTQQQLVNTIKADVAEIRSAQHMLSGFIPLGWSSADFKGDWWVRILYHLPGWAMTVLAIIMGAPFWFDLLNKISNLRGAGNRPPTAADTAKK